MSDGRAWCPPHQYSDYSHPVDNSFAVFQLDCGYTFIQCHNTEYRNAMLYKYQL